MQLQIQPSLELDKACEAVRAGAEIIEVEWRCLPEAHAVEVLIRDNGTGMDDDVQNDIFEPFFSTKEAGKGVGLGWRLSTAPSVNIPEPSSRRGEGTTVTFRLPT
jgi:signal transduction histidine kinase